MADVEEARSAGRSMVSGVRRQVAGRVADQLLRRDPAWLPAAMDSGLIRREWLDEPGGGAPVTSAPVEVVERFLARSVERHPSLLSRLGLNAIQVLSSGTDDTGDGAAARLAVAFTDLEGFTRYTAANGDEAASALLADHHRSVGPIVRSRGGRVVKHLGDGLLLTFSAPEAAVLACLELCDAAPSPLRLRAGVHLGDVLLHGDDVIGHVVNVAARVAESAKGDQVLVTGAVRDELVGADAALPDKVQFGRCRRRSFKGVEERLPVYPVVRVT